MNLEVSSVIPPVTANLAPFFCAVVFPQVTENAEWHPIPKAMSVGPLRGENVGRTNLSYTPVLQIGSPITCPSHRTSGQEVPILGRPSLQRASGAIPTKPRLQALLPLIYLI